MKLKRYGFTLIELLIAMALLAVLALLLVGNFTSTLRRGRDAQRKNDLNQLQRALEVYYEDTRSYPTFDIIANSIRKLCTTESCATTNETIYMMKTPQDPNTKYTYLYAPEPTPAGGGPSSYYYLYSYLENTLDAGSGVSQTGFTTEAKCDIAKDTTNCLYYVGSSNAPILIPN